MSEEINPWKALRFACDGLERICMGTADEADSSSIAEKALFAAIGHMGVSDIAVRELAAPAGEDAEPPRLARQRPVTAATPGQAAYEAYAKAIPEDLFPEHLRGMGWTAWEELRDVERPAWEAAAAAVETQQVRLARQDRDQLRTAVLSLAAELENEAAHTLSREAAEAKRAAAQQLRKTAEPPA